MKTLLAMILFILMVNSNVFGATMAEVDAAYNAALAKYASPDYSLRKEESFINNQHLVKILVKSNKTVRYKYLLYTYNWGDPYVRGCDMGYCYYVRPCTGTVEDVQEFCDGTIGESNLRSSSCGAAQWHSPPPAEPTESRKYITYADGTVWQGDCSEMLYAEFVLTGKKLKYVSGNNQDGDILASLENQFVVKVVDENNSPTTGNVTWQITSTPSNAQGYGLSTTIGISSTLTLGTKPGDYVVTAACTDCTENGTVTFKARAKEVKIEIDAEETSLSPLTDADNTGPSGEREIDFSKIRKTRVTVKVTRDDEPYPDYPVLLQSIPVPYSGGHDHDNDRRKGNFTTLDGTQASEVLRTDSNGITEVMYESSGIAGIETIEASSAVVPDIKDSVDVTLKIEGLVVMPDSGDNLPIPYLLRGQTAIHKDNHYVTPKAKNALLVIASAYSRKFVVDYLQFNDMSLKWGGPFDISGNWRNPHLGHREGKNVDMRYPGDLDMSDPRSVYFLKMLKLFNGKYLPESNPPHVHITIP